MAEQIQFNLDLNNDPKNQRTVGELREEFKQLEEQVDNTTQGTEEYNRAVRRLGEVQGELEKVDRAIEAMNPERKAQVIGDAVSGMAGGFQAAVASAELFGVENEAVLESLQRVNAVMAITEGITAFSEKIPAMKTLIATMPRLTSALKGARVGFQGLSTATKALGIGLLVSAVALLVTHWDDVKKVVNDLFPGLEKMGGLFGTITDAVVGAGKAILKWLATPLKGIIALVQGDFEGAKDAFVEGFDIIGNTADAFNEQQAQRAEERRKKQIEEAIKTAEREREIMEARGQNTMVIEDRIFEMKKELYSEDSEEYKQLMHQKDLEDARRTAKLNEEQRKRKEQYQQYLSELEQARTEATQRQGDEIIEPELDAGNLELNQDDAEELLIFNGEIISRSKFETMQLAGELALTNQLMNDEVTREEFRQKQLENQLAQIDAELSITEQGTDRYLELQKQRADASIQIANAEADAKIATYQKTGEALGQLSRLAGEQTVLGKALGAAQATIDTYVGANKALAQGGIFGIVSAASIIATGLANVRQILSTQVPSIQGQPLGTPAASPLAAGGGQANVNPAVPPEFNDSGVNTVNTVASETDRSIAERPVKAVVVETDITQTQNRVNEIERQASF